MGRFPDPARMAPGESLVAIEGDLRPETLLEAYAAGIFPWPQKGAPLLWHSPDPRGVLDFADLRVPRSLKADMRRGKFTFTADRAFPAVMRACAEAPRPGQRGTWITPAMLAAYGRLHELGVAHSIECWSEGELVGGLYGVHVAGVFSGESMFHAATGASKACLVETARRLKVLGHSWMDVQMVTPVTGMLGAREIPRREFLRRLKTAAVPSESLPLASV